MLKQRVITALLLLPLVMAAIFALPASWFMALIAIIFLAGSWEYRRLAGLSSQQGGFLLLLVQAVILIWLFSNRNHWQNEIVMYMVLCCIAWLLMFVRLGFYQANAQPDGSYRSVSLLTAVISISTAWFAFSWIRLQPEGSWLILLLLLIVWAADTGAYFSGKSFGKRKLAPNISPGKTRAGLIGALILAPLVALIASTLMPMSSIDPVTIILISLLTALVSAGGDLLISLHKRTSGIKDSGQLLPGHGGVLDRIDSLLAAAPFFALALLVSGY